MCNPSSETLRVGEEQWTRLLLVAVCFAFFGKCEVIVMIGLILLLFYYYCQANAWPFSVFTPKQVFGPRTAIISTDLDRILHTLIVVRNTVVGRLRPRSARGWLQAKPE